MEPEEPIGIGFHGDLNLVQGNAPLPPAMALTLFAVNGGYLDDVDVKNVLPFERAAREFIKTKYADLMSRIETTKDLTKEDETKLNAAMADFKNTGAY